MCGQHSQRTCIEGRGTLKTYFRSFVVNDPDNDNEDRGRSRMTTLSSNSRSKDTIRRSARRTLSSCLPSRLSNADVWRIANALMLIGKLLLMVNGKGLYEKKPTSSSSSAVPINISAPSRSPPPSLPVPGRCPPSQDLCRRVGAFASTWATGRPGFKNAAAVEAHVKHTLRHVPWTDFPTPAGLAETAQQERSRRQAAAAEVGRMVRRLKTRPFADTGCPRWVHPAEIFYPPAGDALEWESIPDEWEEEPRNGYGLPVGLVWEAGRGAAMSAS